MVLLWIGIALGVFIVLLLIIKLIKTPSHEAITFEQKCQKCGTKLVGLKCPKCEKSPRYGI